MAPPKPPASPAPPGSDGEVAAIERIGLALAEVQGGPPTGEVWLGDDAAVVAPPEGFLLLATDAALAGVHADLALVGLDDLGWKALTAAVSDIGAMGGRPVHALVTACVPPGTDLDALIAGVAGAARATGCVVVGGDLSTAGQVVVSVAVTGTLEGDGPPVTRSGADPGAHLFVTGPLGSSAAGLRLLRRGGDPSPGGAALVDAHRRPRARVAEGVAARRGGASAMIDVSDGLSIDLDRLALASGVGVRLDALPVAEGATPAEGLGGGEDYELVIAAPDPGRLEGAFAAAGLSPPLPIGRCTDQPAERTLDGEPLPRTGWEHRL